jgi:hypothetical protein
MGPYGDTISSVRRFGRCGANGIHWFMKIKIEPRLFWVWDEQAFFFESSVNKLIEKPVVRDGEIVIRSVMNLSASFDHRLIDGWGAASMIQHIKNTLKAPSTITL